MNILFFGSLLLYFIARALQFATVAFKKEKLGKAAWFVFLTAFAAHTVYIIVRGIAARRLPLSNQFEFATAFAWSVALMLLILRTRMKAEWLSVIAMPMTFFLLPHCSRGRLPT